MSEPARTLDELGLVEGQIVVDRYGRVQEVIGVEPQGSARTTAVKVRDAEDGSLRRLMPHTLHRDGVFQVLWPGTEEPPRD